jgi:Uma2 family endonuclease
MRAHAEFPLTIEDLEVMPDDGNRYELIEGELFVSTAPTIGHQRVIFRVIVVFADYLDHNPCGELLPGIGVVFDRYSGVIPDLVFFTHEREQDISDGRRLNGAPDIVIEILSPGAENQKRDRHHKLKLYSVRGVGEYWLFDPEHRVVLVYRKKKTGGLKLAATLGSGDELTSPLLPGFAASVSRLLATRRATSRA